MSLYESGVKLKDLHPNEYGVWKAMRWRCNPKNKYAIRWHGRGIKVDPRWDEFANFFKDMGERPNGHTIDRIINDEGYYPENCRWATRKEQANNISRNNTIEHEGRTYKLTELHEIYGIPQETLRSRIKRGLAFDEVVSLKSLKGRGDDGRFV